MSSPAADMSAYWDPIPDVLTSTGAVNTDTEPPERALKAPDDYFRGTWAERIWLNVPGPIYGALTDNCWVGRHYAPHHVLYDHMGYHTEYLFRQPRTKADVIRVLFAASADPYGGWQADGDKHWNAEAVRDWWRDRGRVREALLGGVKTWSEYGRAQEREAVDGMREYLAYLDAELKLHLRGYVFWLLERHVPGIDEKLPDL